MEKIILFAILITFVFSLLKYVEMTYLDKERRSMKIFVRDAIYVFSSSLAVLYIVFQCEKQLLEFFHFITDSKETSPIITQIFTDDPGF